VNASASKLKKQATGGTPQLQFGVNPDILASVAKLARPPFCVGFAAESENLLDNARAKLASKKVPLIVANRAQDALGADASELHLVEAGGVTTLAIADSARRRGGSSPRSRRGSDVISRRTPERRLCRLHRATAARVGGRILPSRSR